jgi:DNA-binding NarL/FixJ family response regulator
MNPRTVLILCLEPALAMQWREQLMVSPQLKVAGITNSPESVRAMLAQHGADLVLADLRIMEGTTNGAIRGLRSDPHEELPHVVVVADRLDNPLLLQALRAGADSFHVPALDPLGLAECVVRALDGESPIVPAIARQLQEQFARTAPTGEFDTMGETALQLTPVERQLLSLLSAEGTTLAQLAEAEKISVRQLGQAVRGIYRKLRWNLRANALSLKVDTNFEESSWQALQPTTRRPR